MKIGIFTLPLHTNYGGILQAFALQKVLKELGHEVWLINREQHFKLSLKEAPKVYLRRIIRKYLLFREDAIVFLEREMKIAYPIKSRNTIRFVNEYIQPNLSVKNVKDIPINFFEAIVVGSDQIWRPRFNKSGIENSFLDFTRNWSSLRRIAYGVSFGTAEWEYSKLQTRKCKKLVQRFEAVSVREDSGIDLCRQYLDYQAHLVLDPTMLLDILEYMKLIETHSKNTNGELFTYVLDINGDKLKGIEKVSQILNYTAFDMNSLCKNVDDKVVVAPVEDWLVSLYQAKYILTDSFHGCVFSILFNKPFIAYSNRLRGLSRFQSLLKTFKLEDRLVENSDQITGQKIAAEIDWERTNKILMEQREKSIEFLIANLQ